MRFHKSGEVEKPRLVPEAVDVVFATDSVLLALEANAAGEDEKIPRAPETDSDDPGSTRTRN
jgi:hypothetical protein